MEAMKKPHIYQRPVSVMIIAMIIEIIIPNFTFLYKDYLEKLVDKNNIWTDQVIWTFIFKNNPNKFYKYCDGYGSICLNMF